MQPVATEPGKPGITTEDLAHAVAASVDYFGAFSAADNLRPAGDGALAVDIASTRDAADRWTITVAPAGTGKPPVKFRARGHDGVELGQDRAISIVASGGTVWVTHWQPDGEATYVRVAARRDEAGQVGPATVSLPPQVTPGRGRIIQALMAAAVDLAVTAGQAPDPFRQPPSPKLAGILACLPAPMQATIRAACSAMWHTGDPCPMAELWEQALNSVKVAA